MRILSLILASGFAAGVAAQPNGPRPAMVEVDTALQDEVAATAWVPGTVVSRNHARIAAEVPGRVTWVAEVGTAVEAGEAIATIEDRDLQLQLQENAAALKRLEAQVRYQESQVTRLEQLARSNNAAATQLDEARSSRDVLKQEIAGAEISRAQIAYRIEKSRVTAPFPGRIAERLAQPGEYVTAGAAIARLVDTVHKEVRARAPLASARFIADGMVVTVRDEYQEAKNPIRTVIPVGDERSRMIEIRIALEQPDWVIGGAVRVALPSTEVRKLVTVPRDALVLRGNETYVYRVGVDQTAERVDVTTGIGLGTMVEVIGDIAPGDQLIVRGGERLRPGQPVTIVGAES